MRRVRLYLLRLLPFAWALLASSALAQSYSQRPACNYLGVCLPSLTIGAALANQLQITGAATGTAPALNAIGSDTNISIAISPKGSGQVVLTGNSLLQNGLSLSSGTISSAGYSISLPLIGGTPDGAGAIGVQIAGNNYVTAGAEIAAFYSDANRTNKVASIDKTGMGTFNGGATIGTGSAQTEQSVGSCSMAAATTCGLSPATTVGSTSSSKCYVQQAGAVTGGLCYPTPGAGTTQVTCANANSGTFNVFCVN